MCRSIITTSTGCGHTMQMPWPCRAANTSGQRLCQDWNHPSEEYRQALPRNCSNCDHGPIDPSRWREIGIQPQDPVFTRIGSVADRYVPTPPPQSPSVSRHTSRYRNVEDYTRVGVGADPSRSEIDRRVLDWGRDVPHPNGYDTRYTPPNHANDGVYRRSSVQENLHSSSRAGSSAPHHHHRHHHLHRSSRAENTTRHDQPGSSSRIGSSATHHHSSRLEKRPSRQSNDGAHLYNTPRQPSPRAESHAAHRPSIENSQALIPRRRLDISHVRPGYEDADDYTRHLSEQHDNDNNNTQVSRNLFSHALSPARPAAPSLPSVTGDSTAQRLPFQPRQQPQRQPDTSNTDTATSTVRGTVGGTSPTAIRRGTGTHGGNGGMSYFRGPAPGFETSRRFY